MSKQVASIAVFNADGKLLMGKRRDNGRWTLPGGHLNEGETPHAGAVRELLEEAGIDASKTGMQALISEQVKTFTGKDMTVHAFKHCVPNDTATSMVQDPDKEVERWQWLDSSAGLPEEVMANLHSPKNVTLKHLGLQNWEEPVAKAEDTVAYHGSTKDFKSFKKPTKKAHNLNYGPGIYFASDPAEASEYALPQIQRTTEHAKAFSELYKDPKIKRARNALARKHGLKSTLDTSHPNWRAYADESLQADHQAVADKLGLKPNVRKVKLQVKNGFDPHNYEHAKHVAAHIGQPFDESGSLKDMNTTGEPHNTNFYDTMQDESLGWNQKTRRSDFFGDDNYDQRTTKLNAAIQSAGFDHIHDKEKGHFVVFNPKHVKDYFAKSETDVGQDAFQINKAESAGPSRSVEADKKRAETAKMWKQINKYHPDKGLSVPKKPLAKGEREEESDLEDAASFASFHVSPEINEGGSPKAHREAHKQVRNEVLSAPRKTIDLDVAHAHAALNPTDNGRSNVPAEGMKNPIILGKLGSHHVILDGNHRLIAAHRQGLKTIKAHVLELPKHHSPLLDVDGGVGKLKLKKSELDKGERGDWQSEGYTVSHEKKEWGHRVIAKDSQGRHAGTADFIEKNPGSLHPNRVEVHPGHQRKGLASAMLTSVEQASGMKVMPSDRVTKDGKALQDAFQKSELEKADGKWSGPATHEEVEAHIDRTCPHAANSSRNARLHAGTHYDKWTKVSVPLKDIIENAHSKRDVSRYTKMIQSGKKPPAVVLGSLGQHEGINGGRHVIHSVEDGAHRVAAAKAAGLTHIDAYVGQFDSAQKVKKSELEKGFKEAAAGISMAAALAGASTSSHQDEAPRQSVHAELRGDLKHIAMMESSGGQNKAHHEVTHGLNAGDHAAGSTGLMPITAKEAISKNPDLTHKYGHLLDMDHAGITHALNTHPDMEADIATQHWGRLDRVFKGDTSKMAYAWKNGITGAKQATAEQISNHPYVKKFNELRAADRAPAMKKHDYSPKRNSELHGWISPEGEYHKMDKDQEHGAWINAEMNVNPGNHEVKNQVHAEAYSKGWVSVGHGGNSNAKGSALLNPRHPATKKLKELVRDHHPSDKPFEMNVSDKSEMDAGNTHSVEPQAFAKHGVLRDHYSDQPIRKSEVEEIPYEHAVAMHKKQWLTGKHAEWNEGEKDHFFPFSKQHEGQPFVRVHVATNDIDASVAGESRVHKYKKVLQAQGAGSMGPAWVSAGRTYDDGTIHMDADRTPFAALDGNHRVKAAQELGHASHEVIMPKAHWDAHLAGKIVRKSEAHTASWLNDLNPDALAKIPRLEGAPRAEALRDLASATQTRKNNNGDREFLLHRGLSASKHIKDGVHNSPYRSAWTPKKGIADHFARDRIFEDDTSNPGYQNPGHLASAWVKEDDIHHIPRASVGKGHPSYDEHEVIVRENSNSPIHSAQTLRLKSGLDPFKNKDRVEYSELGKSDLAKIQSVGHIAKAKSILEKIKSPQKNMTEAQLSSLKENHWHNPDTGTELQPDEAEEHLQRLQQKKADKKVSGQLKVIQGGKAPAKKKDKPSDWFGKAQQVLDELRKGFQMKRHDFPVAESKHAEYTLKNNQPDSHGYFTVEAFKGKHEVGSATLRHHGDHIRAIDEDEAQATGGNGTTVSPEHQRKGIATAMYAHAEKVTGKTIRPAEDQSLDAAKLWDHIDGERTSGKWSKKIKAIKLSAPSPRKKK